jgi:8-oxo-dGTP diphosphatase
MELPSTPIAGVGAVITNDAGQLVLIRRGNPPRADEWSIPGGKVEFGETVREALRREVQEETGLTIEIERLVDVVDLVTRDASGAVIRHFVLIDFKAVWISGDLTAGNDASEARWVDPAMLDQYSLWEETRRVIEAALSKQKV